MTWRGLFQVLYGKTDRDVPQGGSPQGHRRRAPHHSRPQQARQRRGLDQQYLPGRVLRPVRTATVTLTWSSALSPASSYLFQGSGSSRFLPKPEEMKARRSAADRQKAIRSDQFVVDWDLTCDGDLDILSGSSRGGIAMGRKSPTGPGSLPRLEPFRKLIEHGPRVDYGSILRDTRTSRNPLTDTRIADHRRRQRRWKARHPGR